MPQSVYGKFESKKTSRPQFFITSNKKDADAWTVASTKREKEHKANLAEAKSKEDRSFKIIYEEIFESFVAFYDLVPLLMLLSNSYPVSLIETHVIGGFRSKGKKLKCQKGYELYEIDEIEYSSIGKGVRRAKAAAKLAPKFEGGYMLSLLAQYDYYIFQILNTLMEQRPHLVFNKELSITYGELENFQNMDGARQFLVQREIEKVLRLSHMEQLSWFSKSLDMKMEPEPDLLKRFVEVCERRNAIAHTGGLVNPSYIENCKKYQIDIGSLKIGDKLAISLSYFNNAIETIIEMSFQILYVVWHKVDPVSGKEASKSLINITYNLILDEKYDLAIKLINFILDSKSSKLDESTRKTHIINVANAMKLSGRGDYVEVINREDWTACTISYLICRAAILDDEDEFVRLVPNAVKSDDITHADLRDWPVFKNMRKSDRVRLAFEKAFKKPLLEKEVVE